MATSIDYPDPLSFPTLSQHYPCERREIHPVLWNKLRPCSPGSFSSLRVLPHPAEQINSNKTTPKKIEKVESNPKSGLSSLLPIDGTFVATARGFATRSQQIRSWFLVNQPDLKLTLEWITDRWDIMTHDPQIENNEPNQVLMGQ